MRCCIASATTSRRKDQHDSALTSLLPLDGQPGHPSVRDHAHILSDFLAPTLSIECEPCGRRGRYNVAKLIEKYGDMKLPELGHVLANCEGEVVQHQ